MSDVYERKTIDLRKRNVLRSNAQNEVVVFYSIQLLED